MKKVFHVRYVVDEGHNVASYDPMVFAKLNNPPKVLSYGIYTRNNEGELMHILDVIDGYEKAEMVAAEMNKAPGGLDSYGLTMSIMASELGFRVGKREYKIENTWLRTSELLVKCVTDFEIEYHNQDWEEKDYEETCLRFLIKWMTEKDAITKL